MAKILKCPRCQESMDVTSVSPGSTVRCPGCGQTTRVPSGATSVAVKTVSAPIPAPPPSPPPAARERATRIRDRNRASGTMPLPPPRKSSSGLFIGLGIGALAVVATIVFFTMKGQTQEPPPHAPSPPKESGPVVFAPKLLTSDKPIVLGSGDSGKGEARTTVIAKPAESVDTANWDALMRDLRPGGGFEHEDRPEGVAFRKVKSFGKAAYPKLIGYIDNELPETGIAAVAVLNALTGRDSPLPRGATKSKVKAEWEEWLKNGDAPKADAPKDPPK